MPQSQSPMSLPGLQDPVGLLPLRGLLLQWHPAVLVVQPGLVGLLLLLGLLLLWHPAVPEVPRGLDCQ